MSDNPEDDLLNSYSQEEQREIKRVQLGLESEAFLRGNLFKYITQRCDLELQSTIAALIDADPEDAKTNRSLRSDIKRYMDFEKWLKELVESGKAAEQNLNAMDATDK